MEVLISKIIALSVLTLLTLAFGLTPFKIYIWLRGDDKSTTGQNRRKLSDAVVACLLHFGGGVLLATGFLHMIPEVRENLMRAINAGAISWTSYPLPELFVCIGFFMVYSIELLAHSCLHQSNTQNKQTCNKNPSVDQAETKLCVTNNDVAPMKNGPEETPGIDLQKKVLYGSVDAVCLAEDLTKSTKRWKFGPAAFRGSLIIAALSFHSAFEGMAVGLQPSSSDVWTLFAAITIHKLVIAFCVGIELTATGMKFMIYFIQIFVYAIMSPIGVGIGIVVMEYADDGATANGLVISILQGLAAGTLIYVTFFEILIKDKETDSFTIIKLICNLVGFAVIAAAQLLE